MSNIIRGSRLSLLTASLSQLKKERRSTDLVPSSGLLGNWPTLSLARGTNRQFYRTGVIIFNKLDNYFVVSANSQTFLGFEMTANFRDTSPLSILHFDQCN